MRSTLPQLVIGWVGIFVLGLIVLRGLQARLISHYKIFYSYIIYVLITSIPALFLFFQAPKIYVDYYWISQLASLLLGLGLTFECFQKAFPARSGIQRLARLVLLTCCVFVILRLGLDGIPPAISTMVELERDLRALQVIMLVWFSVLVSYYRFPLGRNNLGIALGYGAFVSSALVNLTLRVGFGPSFVTEWKFLQPIEYVLCELIWCVLLWSYWPNPLVKHMATDETSTHEIVLNNTRKSLGRLHAYLAESIFR